jgi:phosphohistidine swiveling domain-containing protein
MDNKNHYYKTKLVKMGKWSLFPSDNEIWYGDKAVIYFKKVFGVYKGSLNLFENGFTHGYFPKELFLNLSLQIDKINKKNYRSLANKLNAFYSLNRLAKKSVVSRVKLDYSKLSNKKIIEQLLFIRDWTRKVTIFDQLGFIGEDYLLSLAEGILTKNLGLSKNSQEYNKTFFALTKPARISTTLSEKMFSLKQAIEIKIKKIDLEKASKNLAKNYGWMPVFCFGDPWDDNYYKKELKVLLKKNLPELKNEYAKLNNYRTIRNHELRQAVAKYKINSRDLQKFIDFGLALDVRNEAEYFVSFAGFHLRSLYQEIARRLNLSISQVRLFYEAELVDCLLNKKNPKKILKTKEGYWGFGFNTKMSKRINFSDQEVKKLLTYLATSPNNLHNESEKKGVCASSGQAQGLVRIISSPSQNDRVNEGDILITYATTVDYLPAMKKAAAIITEVGGLTCHAAVVSREFGIPCIIAVKNAMTNFKDGDLIKVNADEGVIRLVKRAK